MNSSNSATTSSNPFSQPRPGRPSLRTPALVNAICTIIQIEGVSDSAAGLLAGISTSSVSRWKLEDEDFAVLLGQARARFDLACLREIRNARKRDGTPDWRAHAWLLQNSSAEGFRKPPRKGKKEAEPKGGDEQLTVTPAELEQMVQARLQAMFQELAREEADGAGPGVTNLPETPRAAGAEGPPRDAGHRTQAECFTQGRPRAAVDGSRAEAQSARSESIADVPEILETRRAVAAERSGWDAGHRTTGPATVGHDSPPPPQRDGCTTQGVLRTQRAAEEEGRAEAQSAQR